MYLLIAIWLLAILFSAVMFTISLIYEVIYSTIISCISGVLSCIGIFYTGYLAIKIESSIKDMENTNDLW